MTSIKAQGLSSLPLAAAWWSQHGLIDRLDSFRACPQPTPRQLPLQLPAHGGMPPVFGSLSAVAKQPPAQPTASCSLSSTAARDRQPDLPLVLVSACLLGYPVTYRGTRKKLPAVLKPTPLLFLTEVLCKEMGLVQCLPVCPEVQWLGLSAPRVPLRLVRGAQGPDGAGRRGGGWAPAQLCSNAPSPPLPTGSSGTLRGNDKREVRYLVESAAEDHALLSYDASSGTHVGPSPAFHAEFLSQLRQDLRAVDGIVLKSYSPSCGVQDARLYEEAVTPPSSTLCSQHPCTACKHVEDSGRAAVAGQRLASSTRGQRRFDLVDGFFTQQLRSCVASMHRADGQQSAGVCIWPATAAPVVTCDRLLTRFYTGERRSPPHLPGNGKTWRVEESAPEAAPSLRSLDSFMESVLQHREWRLSWARN
ncbi:hypothetical protein LSCM1_05019 [Leishmania martiniquensis]|uniref:DUF523 domain-containing protein n=1 Tax=Leishmania martiniquensis TaxID=1580590 RepID=A0A836HA42_9TRYP|nr:hypothetical protein LSCM1_05019 [Leishmania martiniquensis]